MAKKTFVPVALMPLTRQQSPESKYGLYYIEEGTILDRPRSERASELAKLCEILTERHDEIGISYECPINILMTPSVGHVGGWILQELDENEKKQFEEGLINSQKTLLDNV